MSWLGYPYYTFIAQTELTRPIQSCLQSSSEPKMRAMPAMVSEAGDFTIFGVLGVEYGPIWCASHATENKLYVVFRRELWIVHEEKVDIS